MMTRFLVLFTAIAVVASSTTSAQLLNGNMDQTVAVEIVPGFFLPKPASWVNVGSRTNTGPYEDSLSSEPWAGPAPTPVTNGASGLPGPDGCGEQQFDCGVFFKPFTGNLSTGDLATGHLYQDRPGTPGANYVLRGWAGAEANFSAFIVDTPTRALFALDFLDAGNSVISSTELDLVGAGLGSTPGAPFGYAAYSVSGVAPAGTATVRSRISMIDAFANPAGGGQAFVVDDFSLVPEPASMGLALLGLALLAIRRK